MDTVKFERRILKDIESNLSWGARAEFIEDTLYVTGVMPDEGHSILARLKDLGHRVKVRQWGSYQTDYTFAYDFIA